jgi:hypothetical protein
MSRVFGAWFLVFVIAQVASTQEPKNEPPAKKPEYIEVTMYRAVVIGDGTIDGADKVVPIGPERHTRPEAEEDEEKWKKEHPESLRLTDVREVTVRIPVNRPSGARQPELAPPDAASRKPGGETRKSIRVSVFKLIDGKFVRQKELDFDTDDFDQASAYYWQARTREGYSATWHDTKGRKPTAGDSRPWMDLEGAYNKPGPSAPK